ncbi:bifunctional UDP-4-keto-pentose/UDP-xylose synthase [Candidatus Paracaedibacter symbiosus]|uniref:bifunctional UDP-4-keto-pentose/UDP-xylose synthase n=1 Tax=Candidatus Paracaedibacter symbiosus TaxID=244582 RepID=UPI00068BA522|nr:bifunctional UDP-4-keto-pentose/UDP-xylose synthase [Candidatus Paracaedibacter symbiosus]
MTHKKTLILGVNGFIGSRLSELILQQKDWEIYGMDMAQDNLQDCLNHPRFHFSQGDITLHKEWVEHQVQQCDVILPLVAIANPALYVKQPLRVFELDFEANLEIVRLCVKYKKRVIFPSTSEVYGMCPDTEFNEETSPFVLGPTHKQRWIYSCSKQMMDRVIYAYGEQDNLDYTLFRPFNWLGPKLDRLDAKKGASSRVVTQFISNILYHGEIHLVDNGNQRRSFTYIDDGIDALIKIIENKGKVASQKIFNIGNPNNDISVKELAETLVRLVKEYPHHCHLAEAVKIVNTSAQEYYGAGYQDLGFRVPSIENAKTHLNWIPKVDLETALRHTLDHHLGKREA